MSSASLPTHSKDLVDGSEDRAPKGLMSVGGLTVLCLWYMFSGCTLFLNKYILSYLNGDPTVLGVCQLLFTTVCGFIQLNVTQYFTKQSSTSIRSPTFLLNMLVVGILRFGTVVLSLVSLKFVAVSFTETVKSSAPLFTVLISRCMLGEVTGVLVNCSLIPVMLGLALCSSNELSFDIRGFTAALSTNMVECCQNVYSKMLISGDKYKYTPTELQLYLCVFAGSPTGLQFYLCVFAGSPTELQFYLCVFAGSPTELQFYLCVFAGRPTELQFYTSLSSVLVQLPVTYFLVGPAQLQTVTPELLQALALNGVVFHLQSFTAYILMGYISPVTYSVANTLKRALLIWFSVVIFGNPVTVLSAVGTAIVLVGVLCYNRAQQYEAAAGAPPPLPPAEEPDSVTVER
ncbi:Solute carrier family 35 member E2B [Amphibalanus amphitrite]|uniref:Solute carrier family 35 member E2B n=1 Tax=Amphibalanus amphitrite TaxID=1232801 RepID=A0A6A4X4W0_AMPAM|nr:Solute carrier family 35 member E2B [Amphibalanus amphitrite]